MEQLTAILGKQHVDQPEAVVHGPAHPILKSVKILPNLFASNWTSTWTFVLFTEFTMQAGHEHGAAYYPTYFQGKTIFLTGATGNLGSCTMHRLVTELHVQRVYVLVRGSRDLAMEKWRRKMPSQAKAFEKSDKIRFIIGDVILPAFGMSPTELGILEDTIDIVIHAAANLSLLAPIRESVRNNCDPVLELARMATNFKKLEKFVFVSSVYSNSHLPDGRVKEKLYPLSDSTGEDIDVELEREEILRLGVSAHTDRFAWPYALSKYLAERLLLERFSSLPLLIVRSSTIGPALRSPFRLFGTQESLPLSHGLKVYLRDPQSNVKWHASANGICGDNILDEIPVDWVSNLVLLHVAAHSRGILHASAGNYVLQTANDLMTGARDWYPQEFEMVPNMEWIPIDSGPQCTLANFLGIANRNWEFSCQKSAALREVGGSLNILATLEEAQSLNADRFVTLLREVQQEASTLA